MNNIRNMIATVDSMVKKIDPKVIVQRSFYDDVSGRLFVSLVKGRREYEVMLSGRYFGNGDLSKVEQSIKAGIERVQHQPIS
ncbi:MAG TPA: hypothetical protein VGV87_20015 [Blastocatellia bacterium]|nr:hypothetical protein [Blastocatellia bacterium]